MLFDLRPEFNGEINLTVKYYSSATLISENNTLYDLVLVVYCKMSIIIKYFPLSLSLSSGPLPCNSAFFIEHFLACCKASIASLKEKRLFSDASYRRKPPTCRNTRKLAIVIYDITQRYAFPSISHFSDSPAVADRATRITMGVTDRRTPIRCTRLICPSRRIRCLSGPTSNRLLNK